MFSQLQIRNFAIVENLILDFHAGLTVITGETGAGKSIVIDALSVLLGGRADVELIRHGAEKAEIMGAFVLEANSDSAQWLKTHDFASDDQECALRRIIHRDGRSKAFINGIAAPVQQLRELGEHLVDIHSQHAHQSLLKNTTQRLLLDEFAQQLPRAAELARHHKQWQQKALELERLQHTAHEQSIQLELLNHQIQELETLNCSREEIKFLEQEHAKLAHSAKLIEWSQSALKLMDDDEEVSLNQGMAKCGALMAPAAQIDAQLKSAVELLNSAAIQLQECSGQIRHYLSQFDLDPKHMQEVENRIASIHQLARKHRVNPEQLPETLEKLQKEQRQLLNRDETMTLLTQDVLVYAQQYQQLARQISLQRQSYAPQLAQKITQCMQTLGMPGGQFNIELEQLAAGEEQACGLEKVHFLVSANPGQPLKPLAKVVSGGELARISLAIQVTTASTSQVPTVIYDEVDVGVGGGIAEIIGRYLHDLGIRCQVVSVTHLAQVAAQGDQHYRVEKRISGNHTSTQMQLLDESARIQEIARMIGGLEMTKSTLAHAKDFIKRAKSPVNQT